MLNIYPVKLVRDKMIDLAQQEMDNSGQALATALSVYPQLTSDGIVTAISLLDTAANRRVLVLDERGIVLTDSQRSTNLLGKIFLVPEVVSALIGYDTFGYAYTPDSLVYKAGLPIVKGGEIVGAIYFYQQDTENAAFLEEVRTNIFNLSAVGVVIFTCCVIFFNITLLRRFDTLLNGITAINKGDYDYRIELRGNDELTDISSRFNDMSSKLKKTEAMRRQFVSDASHELKTPLASIKLLSDSINQNSNVSEENLREFVRDIGDEITRMIDVSESLLSLSRLSDGPERKQVCCDLKQCVIKCKEILRGSCAHYEVSILLDIHGDYAVWGSEDGIFHIAFNLMENAVKYNRPGGNVWVRLSHRGEQVELTVQDNGIGIPPEDIPKIYDRFYRVDKARSRQTGGTGLGLSIVKEWITDLGGHIDAISQPEKGTVFRVLLNSCQRGESDEV